MCFVLIGIVDLTDKSNSAYFPTVVFRDSTQLVLEKYY